MAWSLAGAAGWFTAGSADGPGGGSDLMTSAVTTTSGSDS